MRSASDRRPGSGAALAGLTLAALSLVGCAPAPIYTSGALEKVASDSGSRVELPPPPPLPPPLPPPDLTDLLAMQDPLTRIRPGDVLSVVVRDEPELSTSKARVSRDGVLRLPWIGEVPAVGRTCLELQGQLETRLRRTFVKSAEVSVELLPEECRRVYVLGRVARPGVFSLSGDQQLTLVQLIALAGGFTTAKVDLEADQSSIRLIRSIRGVRRTFRISFEQILERERLDHDVVMQPDDIVFVPPKRELYIFGSVARPGNFPLADGSRLSVDEVLSLAGGFSPTAERNYITIIRHRDNGQTESYQVNVTDERQRATTLVTANDTVIVSDRQTRRVFVVGNVGHPGSFELDERGLTVIRVLARAGWFNRVADGDGVKLLRSTSEGRKMYRVPVNTIIGSGKTEDDPVLVPGDIIMVPESMF